MILDIAIAVALIGAFVALVWAWVAIEPDDNFVVPLVAPRREKNHVPMQNLPTEGRLPSRE